MDWPISRSTAPCLGSIGVVAAQYLGHDCADLWDTHAMIALHLRGGRGVAAR